MCYSLTINLIKQHMSRVFRYREVLTAYLNGAKNQDALEKIRQFEDMLLNLKGMEDEIDALDLCALFLSDDSEFITALNEIRQENFTTNVTQMLQKEKAEKYTEKDSYLLNQD